jgi:hypothetical protein
MRVYKLLILGRINSKFKDKIYEVYLKFLFLDKNYDLLVEILSTNFADKQQVWESWIDQFEQNNIFSKVVDKIPYDNPKLSPKYYTMKLDYYLNNNESSFLECVQKWKPKDYEKDIILKKAEEIINQSETLLTAISFLYLYSGYKTKTLDIYLKLKRIDVFEFVSTHELFDEVSQDLGRYFAIYNETKVIDFLVNNVNKIKVEPVFKIFNSQSSDESKRRLFCDYLIKLFKKDRTLCEPYNIYQIELYCEFDTKELIHFLSGTNTYKIELAKDILKKYLDKNFHKNEEDVKNLYKGTFILMNKELYFYLEEWVILIHQLI